jgi:hypothetical protein
VKAPLSGAIVRRRIMKFHSKNFTVSILQIPYVFPA